MKAKITVHIYAKTSKANKNGQLPIYFRLTVNGERFEFSTKKFIDKSKWSAEQSKMKGNSEEARTINSHLDSLIAKNSSIEKKLIAVDKDITAEVFNNVLTGKTEKQRT